MDLEFKINGETAVKATVNLAVLLRAMSADAAVESTISRSTSLNSRQAEELLRRVAPKSALFLKRIAENNGHISWKEMKQIFEITAWTEFSGSFGKGITRAIRHMLSDQSASLFYWNDEDDWENDPDNQRVFIDGGALQALREATGLEK